MLSPHPPICLSPSPSPPPPPKIIAALILRPILICRATILLIWSNLSLVISAAIYHLGPHSRFPLIPLSSPYPWLLSVTPPPSRHPPSSAPVGPLSGNQPGRAHFSAHIILPVITNEYESPSAGHTRRESEREGAGWRGLGLGWGGVCGGGWSWSSGTESSCVAGVVATRKQAHALLIETCGECLTRWRGSALLSARANAASRRKMDFTGVGRIQRRDTTIKKNWKNSNFPSNLASAV